MEDLFYFKTALLERFAQHLTVQPLYRPHLATKGFRGGSDSKESACNAGDPGSTLGQEDPLQKGKATHSSILA